VGGIPKICFLGSRDSCDRVKPDTAPATQEEIYILARRPCCLPLQSLPTLQPKLPNIYFYAIEAPPPQRITKPRNLPTGISTPPPVRRSHEGPGKVAAGRPLQRPRPTKPPTGRRATNWIKHRRSPAPAPLTKPPTVQFLRTSVHRPPTGHSRRVRVNTACRGLVPWPPSHTADTRPWLGADPPA
jgi:hypothetical protein